MIPNHEEFIELILKNKLDDMFTLYKKENPKKCLDKLLKTIKENEELNK